MLGYEDDEMQSPKGAKAKQVTKPPQKVTIEGLASRVAAIEAKLEQAEERETDLRVALARIERKVDEARSSINAIGDSSRDRGPPIASLQALEDRLERLFRLVDRKVDLGTNHL